jgi:hypothetical protein
MKPIFRPESWHLSEITKVGCQEQRVVHNSGGRDFQVLGSDTYALFSQPLKFVRRCDIERGQLPIREKIDELRETFVGLDLVVDAASAIDQCEPSLALFFNANNWNCEFLIGGRSHPLDQARVGRAAAVAQDGQMIGIDKDHARLGFLPTRR